MLKQLKPEDSSEQNKAIGTQQVEFDALVNLKEQIEEGAIEEEPVTAISQQSESIATRKSNRETRKPARYVNMVSYAFPTVGNDNLNN